MLSTSVSGPSYGLDCERIVWAEEARGSCLCMEPFIGRWFCSGTDIGYAIFVLDAISHGPPLW